MSDTPPYVHRLLDALMRHEPLDFDGAEIPNDVKQRLQAYFADRIDKTTELDVADSDALASLNALLGAAVHAEFGSLGVALAATDDFSWQRTSLGILSKMGVVHVGWYRQLSEQASANWNGTEPPDDEPGWRPTFMFRGTE